jgi:hypothetical protein
MLTDTSVVNDTEDGFTKPEALRKMFFWSRTSCQSSTTGGAPKRPREDREFLEPNENIRFFQADGLKELIDILDEVKGTAEDDLHSVLMGMSENGVYPQL